MPVILHLCPFLSHLFDFARFVSLSLHLSYDPVHWGVPDGSYASDPDGPIRTLEYRSMVQVGCYRSMVQLRCCRSMVQVGCCRSMVQVGCYRSMVQLGSQWL